MIRVCIGSDVAECDRFIGRTLDLAAGDHASSVAVSKILLCQCRQIQLSRLLGNRFYLSVNSQLAKFALKTGYPKRFIDTTAIKK